MFETTTKQSFAMDDAEDAEGATLVATGVSPARAPATPFGNVFFWLVFFPALLCMSATCLVTGVITYNYELVDSLGSLIISSTTLGFCISYLASSTVHLLRPAKIQPGEPGVVYLPAGLVVYLNHAICMFIVASLYFFQVAFIYVTWPASSLRFIDSQFPARGTGYENDEQRDSLGTWQKVNMIVFMMSLYCVLQSFHVLWEERYPRISPEMYRKLSDTSRQRFAYLLPVTSGLR